ncbi:MAG: 4-hydroxythreonine-4-phosphate dehydrogenase PdxA [Bacteroidales bacterium]|nr:4-hydroxythreonine-4-phosphate dehydrogenase PdxA [Bacteroidales bacterium]MCF8455766.1 4-hydroxythreonine-4-phosphate dehydrogenase PdxA [Bacteroidales bacterium]
MKKEKIIIGITQGDVNGIGYEIIIKTLLDNRIYEMCTPIVYGSPKIAAYHRKALNIDNFSLNIIKHPSEANHKRANIINCTDENIRVELGKSTTMAGEAAYSALERATEDLRRGDIQALVTAPINKHNIHSEKFNFPGHTEYLENKFSGNSSLMLMVSDVMKVGVVVGHQPVSKIASLITKEDIINKIQLLNNSLIVDFGIRKPRIAVFGLNPHAGDNGIIGTEEMEIISPAIAETKKSGIVVMGPFPADGFFGSDNVRKFDAILAMYHDQGLVPFKALSFDNGVNFTAGLPVIRTSPAHGTAYELAGRDMASINSFRQSLYLAIDIYKNREEYEELNANPLRPQRDLLDKMAPNAELAELSGN